MKHRGEADFSHSLTDLMSGLAVMFLLVAAIFMVQAARATAAAKDAARNAEQLADRRKEDADELDKLRRKDTQSIARLIDLKVKLETDPRLSDRIEVRYDPDKDPLLLTIQFTNDKLQFGSGECEVNAAQRADLRATLKELFPQVCETVAPKAGGLTQTIALEGHTDAVWPSGTRCGMKRVLECLPGDASIECQRQAFENNVRLSASRAQYVFFQAREVLRDNTAVSECLDKHFIVAGRGQVEPRENNAQSRRVEIKVRVMAARAATP